MRLSATLGDVPGMHVQVFKVGLMVRPGRIGHELCEDEPSME